MNSLDIVLLLALAAALFFAWRSLRKKRRAGGCGCGCAGCGGCRTQKKKGR